MIITIASSFDDRISATEHLFYSGQCYTLNVSYKLLLYRVKSSSIFKLDTP